jgi:hypothetical protein
MVGHYMSWNLVLSDSKPLENKDRKTVKGNGAVCDQKTSEFFVCCMEESIAEDVVVNRVY